MMASLPISPVHCNAQTEKPFSRLLRLAGTCLLTAQSLLLTGAALFGMLGADKSSLAGNGLFLAASLSLLLCTLWSFRHTAATRWLFLPCLACFIALFLTSFAHGTSGLTITTPSSTRYSNPILTLAGLILMCTVLSRLLRWSATKAACNCG